MRLAQHGDLRIAFESRGEGPPLLLVPGIPAISSDWFPFADPLTKRFQVVVYDNRGSGSSDAPPGPYSTRLMAADAVAVLDALKLDRAHVFGVSLGGMIAQELVLSVPARVDHLVLGSTHAGAKHAVLPAKEVSRAFAFETDDWAERMKVLAPFAFAPGVDAGLLQRFVEKKRRDVQSEWGYRGQIAAVLEHDAVERLSSIRRRTLVITGSDDQIIPASNSRLLHERIPGSQLEVIEHAGHLFFVEQPELTRAMLNDFLPET